MTITTPRIDDTPLTCPLCHTVNETLTEQTLAAGGWWDCTRCSQRWTTERLTAVAAYATWESARASGPQVRA